MRMIVLAMLAILGLVLATTTVAVVAEAANGEFYPCEKCHLKLKLTGMKKVSVYHAVNLTIGAHKGLVCADCHVPPTMSKLVGGADIGASYKGDYKELNVVCAECHERTYHDYINLVHGNKTIVCEREVKVLVKGYKNVSYWLHLCQDYTKLSVVPARGCIECHTPHDPHYKPLAPLPPPSRRPPPPDQTVIAYTTLGVVISSLMLIVVPFIVEFEKGERRGR